MHSVLLCQFSSLRKLRKGFDSGGQDDVARGVSSGPASRASIVHSRSILFELPSEPMQVVIRPALSQLLLVANPVISHQEVSWSPIWFLNHCTQAMCSVSLPRLPPIFSNVTDGLFREPVRNSACRRVLLVAPVARAKRYGLRGRPDGRQ